MVVGGEFVVTMAVGGSPVGVNSRRDLAWRRVGQCGLWSKSFMSIRRVDWFTSAAFSGNRSAIGWNTGLVIGPPLTVTAGIFAHVDDPQHSLPHDLQQKMFELVPSLPQTPVSRYCL